MKAVLESFKQSMNKQVPNQWDEFIANFPEDLKLQLQDSF
jgi:hypothetical protein